MNSLIKKILFFTCIIFCLAANAQKFNKKKRYWSVGGSLNAMNYMGDLNPFNFFISTALPYTRWNFGATVLYRYGPRTSFRGAFAYGRIEGDDRKTQSPDYAKESYWRYIRGTNFRNELFELKVDAVFDLFENRGRYNKRVIWTPYAFIGLAYLYHNPVADYGQGYQPVKDNLKSLKDKSPLDKALFSHQLVVPFGIGVRWRLTGQWDIAAEFGWRKTFTPYLDGVSGPYGDPRTMTAQEKLYDNPSMVGYGSNGAVTDAINKQGVYVYDMQGTEPTRYFGGGENVNNAEIVAEVSQFQANPDRYYVTPRGFGWGESNDKKAEIGKADWYMVIGVHLTYIIPEYVKCPKFRD
ncbi:MAG: DUF6089 family protein [Bacteroidota bacterium]|nr:DUF6089 family protein [Bacteroidota bacterium]